MHSSTLNIYPEENTRLICTCIYMYIHRCTCIYMYMYTSTCIYMYINTHTYMYIQLYIHVQCKYTCDTNKQYNDQIIITDLC